MEEEYLRALLHKVWPMNQPISITLELVGNGQSWVLLHTYWIRISGGKAQEYMFKYMFKALGIQDYLDRHIMPKCLVIHHMVVEILIHREGSFRIYWNSWILPFFSMGSLSCACFPFSTVTLNKRQAFPFYSHPQTSPLWHSKYT